MSRPSLLAAIPDLLKKMLELPSGWAVHLASPRKSESKSAHRNINRRVTLWNSTFVAFRATVYFVGAVSGKVTKIGSAKTATTAIMAPGTMIQPVRSVRTWAT